MTTITEAQAAHVLAVVDEGLVQGLGLPFPGQMCVEAAVCYALGEPHSGNPSCVSPVVRIYKIAVNDGPWSSPTARARGMRRVAVAQLGSLWTDDYRKDAQFLAHLHLGLLRRLVPAALQLVAEKLGTPRDAQEVRDAAGACAAASVVTLGEFQRGLRVLDRLQKESEFLFGTPQYLRGIAYMPQGSDYECYRLILKTHHVLAVLVDVSICRETHQLMRAASLAGAAVRLMAQMAYGLRDDAGIDAWLTIGADAAVDALIACGSPGCAFLSLCDPASEGAR